jgi:uncharacterized protein
MPNIQSLLQMLLAIFIGLLGSILFIYLHLPLPWLLGAIFTSSIAMRFQNIPIKYFWKKNPFVGLYPIFQ